MIEYSIFGILDAPSGCGQYQGLCEAKGWVWGKVNSFDDVELEGEGDVCVFLATQALEGFLESEEHSLKSFNGRFDSTGRHINLYLPFHSFSEQPLSLFYAVKESLEHNITSADIVYLSVLYKGKPRTLRCGKDFR